MKQVYQAIASALDAANRCEAEWQDKHRARIDSIMRDNMPSGSGFDAGTQLSDTSKPNRLVFETAFHHMDEAGYYDGWTEHSIIVTPSLAHGFDMRITGRNRNDIKEYIGDVFHAALTADCSE